MALNVVQIDERYAGERRAAQLHIARQCQVDDQQRLGVRTATGCSRLCNA